MKRKNIVYFTVIALTISTSFYLGHKKAEQEELIKPISYFLDSYNSSKVKSISSHKDIIANGNLASSYTFDSSHKINNELSESSQKTISTIQKIKKFNTSPELLNSLPKKVQAQLFKRYKLILQDPKEHWLLKREILRTPSSIFADEVEKETVLAKVDSRAIYLSAFSESEIIERALDEVSK